MTEKSFELVELYVYDAFFDGRNFSCHFLLAAVDDDEAEAFEPSAEVDVVVEESLRITVLPSSLRV